MYQYQNKTVKMPGTSGGRYEIFWTCANAEHVVKKENHPSHLITIKEVEELVLGALFIKHVKATSPQKWLGLGKHQGKYYQAICYFVKRKNFRRCIIETCYVVNEDFIRKLCKLYIP